MGDQAVSGSARVCQGEPERRRFTTSVSSVRTTRLDPSLGVKVRRTIGHRFACTCGAVGRRRDTLAEARSEGRRHVFDEHVGSPSPGSTSTGATKLDPS